MYTEIDYRNALWGKDLYTQQGLLVRAEILRDVIPGIEKKTTSFLDTLNNFQLIPLETLLSMNQRAFSRWVRDVFACIHEASDLAKEYIAHQKDDCPIKKFGDRDMIRVALMGAYKNETDIDIYDDIDNIIFIITDLTLGFNPKESSFGVIAKYIVTNIKSYRNCSITELLELLKEHASGFIIDYDKENVDVFFDILTNIKYEK